MAANRSGSILAADFGNVHTRAILFDLVDGVHRLIAQGTTRTTVGYPFDDVGVGLDRILRELNEKTGRKFVDDTGKIISPEKLDRSGVDYFVATASTGRPMKTVVVGLVPDMSISSGLRAASGTYISVAEVLSLNDERNEEERLNAILLSRPDLIFITGGTESGAEDAVVELAKVARLAVTLTDKKYRPVVIFAGNNHLAKTINGLFEGITTLLIAQNVRPRLDKEDLDSAQVQLGEAFDAFKEQHGAGFEAIGAMSETGVLPTSQSHALLAEYMSTAYPERNTLIVDVGSAVSSVATAIQGQVVNNIYTEFGLGHSASALLQHVGLERIRRWIPFIATPVEIVNYALNKTLRPATIPMTLKDLYLEHALLRAGIEQMVEDIRPQWSDPNPVLDTIIGAGAGLTNTGSKGYTAMLLLDAFQPSGITRLYADPFGVISTVGAVARIAPMAAVQIIEGSGLERLGTSVTVSGNVKSGKPALKARFIIDGETFEHEIEGGHLWVLPLGVGKTLEIELKVLGRGLHIGGKKKLKVTVEGGTAGLIFDARGRPLPLASDMSARAEQFPLWVSEATGDPVHEIDARWLVDLMPEAESAVETDAPEPAKRKSRADRKRRGGLLGRRKKKSEQITTADDRLAAAAENEEFDDLFDDFDGDDELRELRDELSS